MIRLWKVWLDWEKSENKSIKNTIKTQDFSLCYLYSMDAKCYNFKWIIGKYIRFEILANYFQRKQNLISQ